MSNDDNTPVPIRRTPWRVGAWSMLAAATTACAGFGLFDEKVERPPVPVTAPEIRLAIGVERSRLKDLLSEPARGEDRWSANADSMLSIAQHLSRLQRALDKLEAVPSKTAVADEPSGSDL